MHRRRRVDRDLLLENDVQERWKAVLPAAEARLAGAVDDGAKQRLAGKDGNAFR
jgi:hypothetical protein